MIAREKLVSPIGEEKNARGITKYGYTIEGTLFHANKRPRSLH